MKLISDNKRGIHGYKIIDKYECGLVLKGWEVKSARAGTVNLTNSYCFFNRKNELFLCNSTFKQFMLLKVNETGDRKLLMHKRELIRLKSKLERLGSATIKPIKIYFNEHSKIKIEIALVVGMNKKDKREDLKKKESEKYIKKVQDKYL
ncbi:SsrA-binding protein [Mycoplasma sp. Mirounga ES2805-ORL]|uniref:SsrA-binding protein n=1 Tax=Mycoplasma sp. Mirounga ES2805-ORL TaxID=754514 RepID=UPI00197B8B4A|nr:SsrA-binding protein [Mycoplasma sp. Mirounga ES2805-ORL]QSF13403.1 SsrA-binding protein [Mycoplasma sp. Mirounga ES2805-ORL]